MKERNSALGSILVYFQKMKEGLSNHQSVCLCVPPLTTFELPGRIYNEIWYGGNAIRGDLDAIILNPIASIVLKLLRFKVVR
jgi:hypothetical protein